MSSKSQVKAKTITAVSKVGAKRSLTPRGHNKGKTTSKSKSTSNKTASKKIKANDGSAVFSSTLSPSASASSSAASTALSGAMLVPGHVEETAQKQTQTTANDIKSIALAPVQYDLELVSKLQSAHYCCDLSVRNNRWADDDDVYEAIRSNVIESRCGCLRMIQCSECANRMTDAYLKFMATVWSHQQERGKPKEALEMSQISQNYHDWLLGSSIVSATPLNALPIRVRQTDSDYDGKRGVFVDSAHYSATNGAVFQWMTLDVNELKLHLKARAFAGDALAEYREQNHQCGDFQYDGACDGLTLATVHEYVENKDSTWEWKRIESDEHMLEKFGDGLLSANSAALSRLRDCIDRIPFDARNVLTRDWSSCDLSDRTSHRLNRFAAKSQQNAKNTKEKRDSKEAKPEVLMRMHTTDKYEARHGGRYVPAVPDPNQPNPFCCPCGAPNPDTSQSSKCPPCPLVNYIWDAWRKTNRPLVGAEALLFLFYEMIFEHDQIQKTSAQPTGNATAIVAALENPAVSQSAKAAAI